MTCTFFGHRDTPTKIEPLLKATLQDLIENKGVDLFYVGNQGNFDAMVRKVLSKLSQTYPITYRVVLAYFPKEEMEYSNYTILPDGIEDVPPRFAISYRNKWMLEKADYVITYVTHPTGGAAQFKTMAQKQRKIVLECSINETEKPNIRSQSANIR